MMIIKGNRRVFVVTELLISVIILGVLATIRPDASGILVAAITAIGTIGTLYLGADGYIKTKTKKEESSGVS